MFVSLVYGVWRACPPSYSCLGMNSIVQVGGLQADGGMVCVGVCIVVGCTVLRATVTVSLFVVS